MDDSDNVVDRRVSPEAEPVGGDAPSSGAPTVPDASGREQPDAPAARHASSSPTPRRGPAPGAYVRAPRHHRTVAPVDDLAQDEADAETEYSHDSNYTSKAAGPLSGMGYRRSRQDMPHIRHDLHYGQYLEIPKGRRSIFASRERSRRTKSIVALVVLVVVLVAAAVVVWNLMSAIG